MENSCGLCFEWYSSKHNTRKSRGVKGQSPRYAMFFKIDHFIYMPSNTKKRNLQDKKELSHLEENQRIQIVETNTSIVGCNPRSVNSYIPKGEPGITGPTGPTGPTLSIVGEGNGNILLNDKTTDNVYYSNSLEIVNDTIKATNIIPYKDNEYVLGTESFRWKDISMGPGTINIYGPLGVKATIGSDNNGIAYTERGFASPFINVGPARLTPSAVGGWEIGPTGTAGTSNYDLVAIQKNSSGTGTIGPYYSLIKGVTGPTGETGPSGDKYATTSTTSIDLNTLQIGIIQTLIVDIHLSYTPGQEVVIANDSVSTTSLDSLSLNYFRGVVSSYDPQNGTMNVLVELIAGSGTYSTWQVNLEGSTGAQGPTGYTGPQGIQGVTGP